MDEIKRSHGIPYRSKLRPYVDQIRKWRRAGFTWADIATFFPYRRDDDLLPILNLAGAGPLRQRNRS